MSDIVTIDQIRASLLSLVEREPNVHDPAMVLARAIDELEQARDKIDNDAVDGLLAENEVLHKQKAHLEEKVAFYMANTQEEIHEALKQQLLESRASHDADGVALTKAMHQIDDLKRGIDTRNDIIRRVVKHLDGDLLKQAIEVVGSMTVGPI